MHQDKYNEAPGIRRSDLWLMDRSPEHFRYNMDNPPESTTALLFGTAVHKFILEPDTFKDEYMVIPKIDKRTRDGKEKFADFMSRAMGRAVIDESDYEVIQLMARKAWEHPVGKLFRDGRTEEEFYWTDSATGEACKCKTDCIAQMDGQTYIIDYKTTRSCAGYDFEYEVRKYGYKFQAGMYHEGVLQCTAEDCGFIFLAQEKDPPYSLRAYVCDPEFINQGYDKFRELIGLYHKCRTTGEWPGYEGTGDDWAPCVLFGE